MKQVSTENLFKPSMRKGVKERCTLAEMCLAIGIPILMHKDFSTRVCKPCGRKIRNANECYNLANESPLNVKPKTSPTTSPVRYKRSIKKIIINLVRGNLKTVANMLFKLPNIEEYLRGALTRTVACEFKQHCGLWRY
jgi:hypothetical protein